MNLKKLPNQIIWFVLLSMSLVFSNCSDPEFTVKSEVNPELELNSNLRSKLPKHILDSTRLAESLVEESRSSIDNSDLETDKSQLNAMSTLVNYALQATVTAESTYPGYSVLKIKDGSRNTTVGPSYSWANNFPAGGKLPESVFLKFNSTKTLNRIDIYTSSGYPLKNYTILYRAIPNGIWLNLLSVTGNTAVYRTHSFADIYAIEVQVRCELGPSNQSIYGRLNEVELYGPSEPTLPPITVQNGMLVFASSAAVEQAMDYLEYKYDQYSDAFASQYTSLTDDQLADIEESTGFNDEQPFIAFENQYGISSLRAQITAAEDLWLATTAGDETAGTDPDDTYMDEVELRALVNANGEIKVGSTYYVFLSDGSYYTYTGGQLPVAYLKSLNSDQALPSNIKFVDNSYNNSVSAIIPLPDCRLVAKNKDKKANGNWRYKWKVKASNGPFYASGRAKAVTKSYRKKYGHWQKRKATIGAWVHGNIVAAVDCSTTAAIEADPVQKRRRKVKSKVSYTNGKVIRNIVIGEFWHSKVPDHIQYLTW